MAMQLGSGKGTGRSRGRSAMNAEINVTPFVDVMLVLLIVFMITAPLLTRGVDVSLPKTVATPVSSDINAPLEISVQSNGDIYVQQTKVKPQDLITQLTAIAGEGYDDRIFMRIDETVDYGTAMDVMTRIQAAGFRNMALITDPKAKKSGGR